MSHQPTAEAGRASEREANKGVVPAARPAIFRNRQEETKRNTVRYLSKACTKHYNLVIRIRREFTKVPYWTGSSYHSRILFLP